MFETKEFSPVLVKIKVSICKTCVLNKTSNIEILTWNIETGPHRKIFLNLPYIDNSSYVIPMSTSSNWLHIIVTLNEWIWVSIEVKKRKSSSSVVYMKKIGTWAIWAYSVWVLIFLTPPFKFKAETEDLKHWVWVSEADAAPEFVLWWRLPIAILTVHTEDQLFFDDSEIA